MPDLVQQKQANGSLFAERGSENLPQTLGFLALGRLRLEKTRGATLLQSISSSL